MSVPIEYNIVGGLLGLGQDILLDVLTQIKYIKDTQQIIGMCKKCFVLKNHQRFNLILQNKIDPIHPEVIITNETLISQQGASIVHIGQEEATSIVISPIITEGIVRFEGMFYQTGSVGRYFGLADSSIIFASGDQTWNNSKYKEKNVCYYSDGEIIHRNDVWKNGNIGFNDQQSIAMEVNMNADSRTLHFFIEDKQQQNFVIDIPESVRFYVFLRYQDSSFQITRFERLQSSSVRQIEGQNAFKWGTEW
ncbi:MAG: hypothetical protein EZS28_017101 [Streblomastix strix]|uniref:SPRY domain-containing protein n=1 Tax=Streblomastix strix TaxID=222440 RepID=A0A5J4VXJ7_9EUKA|nr:MAG: hypothetical protein EZS28_017101 [Streblomastix strix]